MCLDVTKLVLRKINSGFWFIQIFLQKMHQIRQKKPKPSKRKWINDERRAVRWATSDERCDRWSTSALVGRAPLIDHAARRSMSDAIIRTIALRDLIDRARRSGAIVRRAAWSTIGALRSGLSLLSLSLWFGLSLLSLSLFLSLSLSLFPEMNWSENEGGKSFPGQRWKFRSTGSYFPENEIYRRCQTPGFGGKWFPEIIFTQNKRTLIYIQ